MSWWYAVPVTLISFVLESVDATSVLSSFSGPSSSGNISYSIPRLVGSLSSSSSNGASSSSSRPLGAIIAGGIGMTSSSSRIATTIASTQTTQLRSSSSPAITSQPKLLVSPSAGSVPGGSSGYGSQYGNYSDCWDSWSNYWQGDITDSSNFTVSTSTDTVSFVYTWPSQSWETITETAQAGGTSYSMNGQFTVGTFIEEKSTYVTVETITGVPAGSQTEDFTETYVETYILGTRTSALPKPSCSLPASVPQCQSSWSAYASYVTCPYAPNCNTAAPACQTTLSSWSKTWGACVTSGFTLSPKCTQARITGSMCEMYKDEWVKNAFTVTPRPGDLDRLSRGYSESYVTGSGTESISWVWPTATTVVPGCTLGCARCAVTGGTIRALYWPTLSSTPASTETLTAVTLGTTLTYPTFYVSYANVYAADSCSKKYGPTINNTIVPVTNTAQISSIYATLVDPWELGNQLAVYQYTQQFNLADLNTPVPSEAYDRQPYCATWIAEHGPSLSMMGNSTVTRTIHCPQTKSYNPILLFPPSILTTMNPLWSTCSADLRGVYDPPLPLTPVGVVAGPTSIAPVATTSASPPPSPSLPTPKATSNPVTNSPQPTSIAAEPESQSVNGPPSYANAPATATQPQQPSSQTTQVAPEGSSSDSPSNTADGGSGTSATTANVDPLISAINSLGSHSENTGEGQQQTTQSVILPSSTADPGQQSAAPQTPATSAEPHTFIDPTNTAGAGGSASKASAAVDPLISAIETLASSAGNGATGQQPASYSNPSSSAIVFTLPQSGASDPSDPTQPAQATANSAQSVQSNPGGVPQPTSGSDDGVLTAIPQGSSIVVVGGGVSTIVPYGSAASISSHSISAASGGIIIDGSQTVPVAADPSAQPATTAGAFSYDPSAQATAQPVYTAPNGDTVSASAAGSGGVVLNNGASTTTIQPGQEATFAGQTISAPAQGSALVIGGSQTVALSAAVTNPSPAAAGVFTAPGGQTVTVSAVRSSVVLQEGSSSTTISLGHQATFAGQIVSVPTQAGGIVIGGSQTVAFPVAQTNLAPAAAGTFTAPGGQTVTASAVGSGIVLQEGGSSISISLGQEATFAGQTISAPTQAGGIVVGGTQTVALASSPAPGGSTFTAANGETIRVNTASAGIVVQQGSAITTIAPGHAATVAGEVISAPTSGSAIFVQGSQIGLPAAVATTFTAPDGQIVTASAAGSSIVLQEGGSSTTFAPGQKATFASQVFSAPTQGSAIVVDGTSTISLASAQAGRDSTISASLATVTASNGAAITISRQAGTAVIYQSGSSVTLTSGQVTTVDDLTVSAEGSDGVVAGGVQTSEATTMTSFPAMAVPTTTTGVVSASASSTAAKGSDKPKSSADRMAVGWLAVVVGSAVGLQAFAGGIFA